MPMTIAETQMVSLVVDGRAVSVPAGTTIWEAARRVGIEIPVLCHSPRMQPVGVCRMCVVDVGERVLAASCVREVCEGMTVETCSPKVERHRAMLTRLLLAEHPSPCERERTSADCELEALGRKYELPASGGRQPPDGSACVDDGRGTSELIRGLTPPARQVESLDSSSPVIAVDHSACILCDRCLRACDDLQSNEVIGRTGKGHTARIAFDLNQPMGQSTCVSCGECVSTCPTGALTPKAITLPVVSRDELRAVDTVCPYCGVGCAITALATDDKIVFVEGRESPVNHGRLCVKGRYGWDYTLHPQRLTKPLIRRAEFFPKGALSKEVVSSVRGRDGTRRPGGVVDYSEIMPAFRETSWDEALDLIASRLNDIKQRHGPNALAGFGSAKCSNEEAYLFQKLIRVGFGTNNVDHCTRLCHASSVAALMETIGSGAVTNIFADVSRAAVALITGSNTTANHPVAATFIKEAIKRGTKLIVVDVRRHDLCDFATHFAQIRPGTDVAFYNGLMHVLIREGWIDREYIEQHTENFSALRDVVMSDYSPEKASAICGISASEIEAIARTVAASCQLADRSGHDDQFAPFAVSASLITTSSQARLLAATKSGMLIFWGMGISQHSHGTDNARCLISLCLLTGNVGKPGTGLHPLRGQNNVQGASDAGLIPMVFPDYQKVVDPVVREKFEQAWGVPLDPNPGLTVVEIMKAALEHKVRGMYILGENPFISDPNSNKVRKALASLDFLVVQDIFITETAEFADVILPASTYFEKDGTYTNTDRRVQLGRQVLDPPGDARQDWRIICDIAKRIDGLNADQRAEGVSNLDEGQLTSKPTGGLTPPAGQNSRWDYNSPADVFDELASVSPSYHGLSHANLGLTGKLWPCADPEHGDGEQILFVDEFPTQTGRGKFVLCRYQPAAEVPDDEYPFVLNTGRVLEHWHTGSMTRRSRALDAIEPSAFAAMHPLDLSSLGIEDGERIEVRSRRGAIELDVRSDDSLEPGCVFIPFHFREAAANVLTTDVLDPFGKIPEFKFCAVQVQSRRIST